MGSLGKSPEKGVEILLRVMLSQALEDAHLIVGMTRRALWNVIKL